MASVESELRVPRLEEEGLYRRRSLGFGEFFGPGHLTQWRGMRLRQVIARAAFCFADSG